MKTVKFLQDYPVIDSDIKNKKGKVIKKKGALVEGGYEKGSVANLNDQLADSLQSKKLVEILPSQTNGNIMEMLKVIDEKLDKLLKNK